MVPRNFATRRQGRARATFAAAATHDGVQHVHVDRVGRPAAVLQRELLQLVHQAAAARRRRGRRRAVASLTPWSRLLPAGLAASVRIAAAAATAALLLLRPDGARLDAPPPAAAPAAADADDDGETLDDIFGGLANARHRDAKRQAAEEAERARSERRRRRRRRAKPPSELVRDPIFGEVYEADPSTRRTPSVRRHDRESGLRVFKAHALGLGRGGGSAALPVRLQLLLLRT